MVYYTFTDENASYQIQHNTAYKLLDTALKKLYGIESYTLEYNSRGKPHLAEYPEIHFNISHCSGLSLCAVSESEIGIDAELIRPYNGKAAKRIFSSAEIDFVQQSSCCDESFFRIWTLKECLGKALGTGLSSAMAAYEFTFDHEKPVCNAYPKKFFTQIILNKKWVVSICADNPNNCFTEIKY